jgi:hypothetical protein
MEKINKQSYKISNSNKNQQNHQNQKQMHKQKKIQKEFKDFIDYLFSLLDKFNNGKAILIAIKLNLINSEIVEDEIENEEKNENKKKNDSNFLPKNLKKLKIFDLFIKYIKNNLIKERKSIKNINFFHNVAQSWLITLASHLKDDYKNKELNKDLDINFPKNFKDFIFYLKNLEINEQLFFQNLEIILGTYKKKDAFIEFSEFKFAKNFLNKLNNLIKNDNKIKNSLQKISEIKYYIENNINNNFNYNIDYYNFNFFQEENFSEYTWGELFFGRKIYNENENINKNININNDKNIYNNINDNNNDNNNNNYNNNNNIENKNENDNNHTVDFNSNFDFIFKKSEFLFFLKDIFDKAVNYSLNDLDNKEKNKESLYLNETFKNIIIKRLKLNNKFKSYHEYEYDFYSNYKSKSISKFDFDIEENEDLYKKIEIDIDIRETENKINKKSKSKSKYLSRSKSNSLQSNNNSIEKSFISNSIENLNDNNVNNIIKKDKDKDNNNNINYSNNNSLINISYKYFLNEIKRKKNENKSNISLNTKNTSTLIDNRTEDIFNLNLDLDKDQDEDNDEENNNNSSNILEINYIKNQDIELNLLNSMEIFYNFAIISINDLFEDLEILNLKSENYLQKLLSLIKFNYKIYINKTFNFIYENIYIKKSKFKISIGNLINRNKNKLIERPIAKFKNWINKTADFIIKDYSSFSFKKKIPECFYINLVKNLLMENCLTKNYNKISFDIIPYVKGKYFYYYKIFYNIIGKFLNDIVLFKNFEKYFTKENLIEIKKKFIDNTFNKIIQIKQMNFFINAYPNVCINNININKTNNNFFYFLSKEKELCKYIEKNLYLDLHIYFNELMYYFNEKFKLLYNYGKQKNLNLD